MSASLEKIARMSGKTTYKDFRNGFSSCDLRYDTDTELKAALGLAQRSVGAVAIAALETKYGSTLAHEGMLRRQWDQVQRDTSSSRGLMRTPHAVAVDRMASALAIRQHAGLRIVQLELKTYAWLVCSRGDSLADLVHECGAWLDSLTGDGERAFRKARQEVLAHRNDAA